MSDYKTLSEYDLLNLLRLGDSIAHTEIYERYYYLMFVFAYKKLRDEDLAKDVVQELFVNLWEKKENIAALNNFTAYLFTIIRNRIFDFTAHQNVK